MSDNSQEQTQVSEQPKADENVSLDNVEIMSNGNSIDPQTDIVDTKDADKMEETEEEDNDIKADTDEEAETINKDMATAKSEMETAEQELRAKGVDYDALETEYEKTGTLSEESFKMLEEKGYPKALISAAIAGWEAKAEAFANTVIKNAGGKREYNRIQNFIFHQGKAAIDAFNNIIDSADLNTVSAYINGIKAQMMSKYGTNNPTLAGNNAGGNVTGYADANEMVKAMSDPRYGKDPKYMAEVEKKVAKSTFF